MATTNGGEDEERIEGARWVPWEDVLQAVQEASGPVARDPGPLTRIGYRLAIFLFIYLSAVTAFLLVDFYVNAPSSPSGALLDEAQVSLYQQLAQISEDRTLRLLDALVLKGFLPVFTAVLGYIFGTRGADREET